MKDFLKEENTAQKPLAVLVVHLFLPSASCILSTASTRFLLWCKVLLEEIKRGTWAV